MSLRDGLASRSEYNDIKECESLGTSFYATYDYDKDSILSERINP